MHITPYWNEKDWVAQYMFRALKNILKCRTFIFFYESAAFPVIIIYSYYAIPKTLTFIRQHVKLETDAGSLLCWHTILIPIECALETHSNYSFSLHMSTAMAVVANLYLHASHKLRKTWRQLRMPPSCMCMHSGTETWKTEYIMFPQWSHRKIRVICLLIMKSPYKIRETMN